MSADSPASTSPKKLPVTLLNIAAIATIATGLGFAIYVLVAPLGVWMRMWDFRQGFSLLSSARPFAIWIVLFGAATTIAGGLGFKVMKLGNNPRLTAFALVATLAAGLAYLVPTAYRTTDAPPIHDITTDTVNPPAYVAIAPLRADAANSMVYGDSRNMTPERLAELQQQAYPDIVPQRYTQPLDIVYEKVLSAIDRLGWELVDASLEDGRIEATDTTFWFRFKDDVVIMLTNEGNETVLNARSLSLVGGSDFGKNAERLRSLFALL